VLSDETEGEPQLHQPTRGVVDEHQQRAGRPPILEPAMLAAVDLDEFAKAFAPQPRLMKLTSLLPRLPQAGLCHPAAKRLAGHRQPMPLAQHLSGKGRSEISILLPHRAQCELAKTVALCPVRAPAARSVAQRRRANAALA